MSGSIFRLTLSTRLLASCPVVLLLSLQQMMEMNLKDDFLTIFFFILLLFCPHRLLCRLSALPVLFVLSLSILSSLFPLFMLFLSIYTACFVCFILFILFSLLYSHKSGSYTAFGKIIVNSRVDETYDVAAKKPVQ